MNPETLLKQTADRLGYHYTAGHEPSFWLRGRLISLTTAPTSCGHEPLLFASLWAEMLSCLPCAPRFRAQGDGDFTCDRCGKVERPIRCCALVWQGLFVSFGLCKACAVAEYGGVE